MKEEFIDFEVGGTTLRIATMTREGKRAPIVFLHGFGSTKEDYADIARRKRTMPTLRDIRNLTITLSSRSMRLVAVYPNVATCPRYRYRFCNRWQRVSLSITALRNFTLSATQWVV